MGGIGTEIASEIASEYASEATEFEFESGSERREERETASGIGFVSETVFGTVFETESVEVTSLAVICDEI
jgi:hypothetical protein